MSAPHGPAVDMVLAKDRVDFSCSQPVHDVNGLPRRIDQRTASNSFSDRGSLTRRSQFALRGSGYGDEYLDHKSLGITVRGHPALAPTS